MKNKYQNIIIGIFIFLSLYTSIKSQNCFITGKVLNKNTQRPISNVNVFLAYTFSGSSTNMFGHYKIENIDPGQYFLVVSHVGFTDIYIQINIKKGGPWERILQPVLTLLFAAKAPKRALLFKA